MTRPGDDTRAKLCRIARDLYLDEGPTGFSLREVARRADISAAAVYRHFEGKDALMGEVCAEGFRIFSGYLLRSLAEPDPRARLLKAGELYLRFGVENPRDYRFIFMGDTEAFGTFSKAHPSTSGDSTFRFLVDRVEECVRAGVFAPGDSEAIATSIWGHVHGLTSLRITGHLSSVDDAAFMPFYLGSIERLFAGLVTPP